jgi:peptidoglycan hydrolase-like protein with peptidoglycan-binding domain
MAMRHEARMTEPDRKRVQEALQKQGFYDGPISGDFGPRTRSAIRDFQRHIGSQPTGHLSAEETEHLVRSE